MKAITVKFHGATQTQPSRYIASDADGNRWTSTFFKTGQKLDRQAIVNLEHEALADLICQADETGRGRGISRVAGQTYIIGKNARSEAICLVWKGVDNSEVTPEILKAASKEVTQAGLKRPFRIYGTFCRVGDTQSWKFCQIPWTQHNLYQVCECGACRINKPGEEWHTCPLCAPNSCVPHQNRKEEKKS